MNIEPFTPDSSYVKMKRFHAWVQTIVPFVYDNSLSFYEVLGKMAEYLNEIRDRQNQLSGLYDSLVAWCNDAIAEQTDFIQKFTDNLRSEWNQFSEDMKNQFKELSDEINQELSNFESKIQQQQNAFETKINGQIETWQNEWDDYKNNLNTEWSTYQTNLTNNWNTYQQNLNKAWEDYQTNLNNEWNDTQNYIQNYFSNLDISSEITSIFNTMLSNGDLEKIISENLGTLIHLVSITEQPESAEIGSVYYNSTDKKFYTLVENSIWNEVQYTNNYLFDYNHTLYTLEQIKNMNYFDEEKYYVPIYHIGLDNYYCTLEGNFIVGSGLTEVNTIKIYKNDSLIYTIDGLSITPAEIDDMASNFFAYPLRADTPTHYVFIFDETLLLYNGTSYKTVTLESNIRGLSLRTNILVYTNSNAYIYNYDLEQLHTDTKNNLLGDVDSKYNGVIKLEDRVFYTLTDVLEDNVVFSSCNIPSNYNAPVLSNYWDIMPDKINPNALSVVAVLRHNAAGNAHKLYDYISNYQEEVVTDDFIPYDRNIHSACKVVIYDHYHQKWYAYNPKHAPVYELSSTGDIVETYPEYYFDTYGDNRKRIYNPIVIKGDENGILLEGSLGYSLSTNLLAYFNGVENNLIPVSYLTKTEGDTYYQPIGDYVTEENANNTYLSKDEASTTYLTQANANSTYLSKDDASNTYLTQANANTTYLPKTEASSTYLTQANANTTYQKKSDMAKYVTSNVIGTQIVCQNSQPAIPSSGQIIWIDTSDL